MSDFKMSEIERPEKNPLRGFDDDDDYEEKLLRPTREAIEEHEDIDNDYVPARKGSRFIGLTLFILIAALACVGYYGYTDLKQSQKLNNVFGTGEFSKLEKKIEALIAENNLKFEQKMQELSTRQAELATQLALTHKKADGYAQDLSKSNKSLVDLRKEFTALTVKHDETVKDLAAAQSKIKLLDKLSKDMAATEARLHEMESTVVTTTASLQALSQSAAKLSGQIETLAKQQTDINKGVAEIAKTQANSGQNNASFTAQLKKMQNDVDKANVEILKIKNMTDANVTKELNALRNELGDIKRKVDLLK